MSPHTVLLGIAVQAAYSTLVSQTGHQQAAPLSCAAHSPSSTHYYSSSTLHPIPLPAPVSTDSHSSHCSTPPICQQLSEQSDMCIAAATSHPPNSTLGVYIGAFLHTSEQDHPNWPAGGLQCENWKQVMVYQTECCLWDGRARMPEGRGWVVVMMSERRQVGSI
jgi:hypothetical protein